MYYSMSIDSKLLYIYERFIVRYKLSGKAMPLMKEWVKSTLMLDINHKYVFLLSMHSSLCSHTARFDKYAVVHNVHGLCTSVTSNFCRQSIHLSPPGHLLSQN